MQNMWIGNPASNTSCIQSDLNTRILIAAPWCAKIIFNIRMFAGANQLLVESKSQIPDILGKLEIPAGCICLGPKRGHVQEKEDVWSPYI